MRAEASRSMFRVVECVCFLTVRVEFPFSSVYADFLSSIFSERTLERGSASFHGKERKSMVFLSHGSSDAHYESDDEVNRVASISDNSTRVTGRIRPPARHCVNDVSGERTGKTELWLESCKKRTRECQRRPKQVTLTRQRRHASSAGAPSEAVPMTEQAVWGVGSAWKPRAPTQEPVHRDCLRLQLFSEISPTTSDAQKKKLHQRGVEECDDRSSSTKRHFGHRSRQDQMREVKMEHQVKKESDDEHVNRANVTGNLLRGNMKRMINSAIDLSIPEIQPSKMRWRRWRTMRTSGEVGAALGRGGRKKRDREVREDGCLLIRTPPR